MYPNDIGSQKVNLDHLKPHKPLIMPPAAQINTYNRFSITTTVNFSLNIHLKNKMLSYSFLPLVHNQYENELQFIKDLSLERLNLPVSSYEWYLHKSRLKDLYNRQKELLSMMRNRKALNNSFIEIAGVGNGHAGDSFSHLNQNATPPIIYYIKPKTEEVQPPAETKTENTSVTVKNETHRQSNTEADTERKTLAQSLNIEHIADKVVKTIEKKMYYDRLKKGR